MKWIHIAAGVLALFAGAIALCATKGSPLHRRSGQVFVGAMLVMTSSAVLMATFIKPQSINQVAGSLTFYLVCTAMLTVRRTVAEARRLLTGLMLLAIAGSAYAFSLGFEALASPRGMLDGIPSPPLFMFGVIGALGAALDARLLRAGSIQGKHRIARHLWRMTFAMWIATASFFLGQADEFPEAIRKPALLAVPVLWVLGMLVYSLIRTLKKPRTAIAPHAMPRPRA